MGAPIRAPKQRYIPLQQHHFSEPLFKWVESSSALLKLLYKAFFCLNPPCLWPGDIYQPSVTMGAPIRAPKQRYIPLQQHHFSQPLSKLLQYLLLKWRFRIALYHISNLFFLIPIFISCKNLLRMKTISQAHTLITALKEIHSWLNLFCHLKEELLDST